MYTIQRTLAKAVDFSGLGVHSGRTVHVRIRPAPVNHGVKFLRTDIADATPIPARFNLVVDTSLATVIGYDGIIVSTIEHLMASLSGLSIDNALIELDNYELPIMDGSAGPFTRVLQSAGTIEQGKPRLAFVMLKPIQIEENGKSVAVYPCTHYRLTCTIRYDHPLIAEQTCSVDLNEKVFSEEICNARTFGFLHEVEGMQKMGLARGGSLDNAIVIDKDGVLNPGGLRYPDEFVRHKLLDCIGDFSLMGLTILGHVVTRCSGHAFNQRFLQHLFAEKTSWEIQPIESAYTGPPSTEALPGIDVLERNVSWAS
ncbi:UDP-3-O-acyl-N-acetylglucosamine deacetylase [Desulfatirhabdium butyrativorans]|uniref:UDP-3-O-acyl-N-acetylglucosamine deacetylase n=1 Tax=Desulfatirhabdium butyrativorans TaxID=340467 RepID=UPI00041C0B7B|nr:UDP-3-O-acyl-N-acetylglucosamine deacetylase [Desulfatirhabdium butyrativorans]